MKRTALGAGLFACAVIFAAGNSSNVRAEALLASAPNNPTGSSVQLAVLDHVEQRTIKTQEPAPAPEKPAPVQYSVQAGETLTAIAEKHQTTWRRLYDKNVAIANPDVIAVGTVLVIPQADEQLAERPLPEKPAPQPPAPKPATARTTKTVQKKSVARATVRRGSVAGNTYTAGYCTWYVKNQRPDLPNNLGNAYTWLSRAAAQGMATGSTPRAGAVGQRGNHVVYVKSVNADGSVNISEMNHKGLYVITHRTLPGNYFTYIY